MVTPGKKQIKRGPGIEATKKKPVCRKHTKMMTYEPDRLKWVCPVADCAVTRNPDISGDGLTVLSDELTLVLVQSSSGKDYYLRSDKYKVMVHVTNLVAGDVGLEFMKNKYNLTLAFEHLVQAEL